MKSTQTRGVVATVLEVEDLSPRLRRVRLGSRDLVGMRAHPGDKVKMQVGPRSMRSYTLSGSSPEEGWFDTVMFRHGSGQGSAWATHARDGVRTRLFGPVPSMPGPSGTESWAWFLGDESTVGLARGLARGCPPSTQLQGAIELDPIDAPALEALDLSLTPAHRAGPHGRALLHWVANATVPNGTGVVWISGHADAVQACQRAVIEAGVDPSFVRCKAYWNRKKDRIRTGLMHLVG